MKLPMANILLLPAPSREQPRRPVTGGMPKSSKATWHSLDLFQSRPFFKRAVRGVALHKVKKIPSQERQGLELFFQARVNY